MYKGILKKVVVCYAVLLTTAVSAAGLSEVQQGAVEDASFKAINELSAHGFDVKRIAFLGLAGKGKTISKVFRAGLLRVPGEFKFYVRDTDEWDVLMSELEFSARKEDIMDTATLSKFGDIKGVDALLYGGVIGQDDTARRSSIRVSLVLAKPETGQLLWSGNITGEFLQNELTQLSGKELNFARKCGTKAVQEFLDANVKAAKVFSFPISGSKGDLLTDVVLGQFAGKSDKHTFYLDPGSSSMKNMARTLSAQLGSGGQSSPTLSQRELDRILLQLEQVFAVEEGTVTGNSKTTAKKQTVCYLQTKVKHLSADELTINFMLRDLTNNQLLWSTTVTGSKDVVAPKGPNNHQKAVSFFEDNRIFFYIGGGVLAIVVGLIFLVFLLKMCTRVR